MRSVFEQVGGVELTFRSNYLGHWALTQQLLPLLRAGHAASGDVSPEVANPQPPLRGRAAAPTAALGPRSEQRGES